jgi:hypothetical protein
MQVLVGSIRPISKLIGKRAWADGVAAVGDIYYRFGDTLHPDIDDVDCWYQFNLYNPYRPDNRQDRTTAYRKIQSSGKPVIVWEEGSFRRLPQYKKFGWHTYLNTGEFNNHDVDDQRWREISQANNLHIHDWESPGDEILIMGQIDFDSALISMYDDGYHSFNHWVETMIARVRFYTDRPIRIRPHPLAAKSFVGIADRFNSKYKNVSVSDNLVGRTAVSGGAGLYLDLARAWCVITYTSNSAVEAVCEGVPVFAMSPENITWDVAHHDLADIEHLDYGIDTTCWFHRVAYTMWCPEEIAAGKTWAHLKSVYFK